LAADVNLDRLVFGKRNVKCRWELEEIHSGRTDMHEKHKVLASSALANPDISLRPSEGTTTRGKRRGAPSPDTLSASDQKPNVIRSRFQNTLELVLLGFAHLGVIYTRIRSRNMQGGRVSQHVSRSEHQ
jgi:hypothetical protein